MFRSKIKSNLRRGVCSIPISIKALLTKRPHGQAGGSGNDRSTVKPNCAALAASGSVVTQGPEAGLVVAVGEAQAQPPEHGDDRLARQFGAHDLARHGGDALEGAHLGGLLA